MNKIEKLKSCPFCGEEARIEVIKPHTHKLATFMPDCEGRSFVECQCGAAISGETRDAAIAAWNRRTEENPKPLTLDELIRMDGEPVWVMVVDHKVFADKDDDFDGWGMCRKSWARLWDKERADLIHVDYDFEDYGKKWLAYRTKPEEEQK